MLQQWGKIWSLAQAAGMGRDAAAHLWVEQFRKAQEGEILQFAAAYKREHRMPLPHVAAKATVMRNPPLGRPIREVRRTSACAGERRGRRA